jgi:hypothetical protein
MIVLQMAHALITSHCRACNLRLTCRRSTRANHLEQHASLPVAAHDGLADTVLLQLVVHAKDGLCTDVAQLGKRQVFCADGSGTALLALLPHAVHLVLSHCSAVLGLHGPATMSPQCQQHASLTTTMLAWHGYEAAVSDVRLSRCIHSKQDDAN